MYLLLHVSIKNFMGNSKSYCLINWYFDGRFCLIPLCDIIILLLWYDMKMRNARSLFKNVYELWQLNINLICDLNKFINAF